MCVGNTLNMDSCSKFWGNLEGIWGNPGKYCILDGRSPGSIGEMLPSGSMAITF